LLHCTPCIQATNTATASSTGAGEAHVQQVEADKVQSVELVQGDITAPTAYSIQEARLKTESDAAAAAAELKKDVARAVSVTLHFY
jgi:hypothetical protein